MNLVPMLHRRRLGTVHVPTVTLAHGGGKAMKDLIDDVFVRAFDNPLLAPLEDQARPDLAVLAARGDRLAFTTDSFVVDPLFFPGGDIGKLAICGTVNDLAVGGAIPLYLSCAAIVEEGVTVELLKRIAQSMARTAAMAGVAIVTGDTKVVQKGACDKLFITTTGIGVIPRGTVLGADRARPGDVVLVNGVLGDHGAAILAARRSRARLSNRKRLRGAQRLDRGATRSGARRALPARRDPRRRRHGAQRDRCSVCRCHRDRRSSDPAPCRGQRLLRNPRP
jgi:hydrogenase expression/formation protein HypE